MIHRGQTGIYYFSKHCKNKSDEEKLLDDFILIEKIEYYFEKNELK